MFCPYCDKSSQQPAHGRFFIAWGMVMKRWAMCQWVDDPADPGSKIPGIGLHTDSYAIVGGGDNPTVLCKFASANLGPINADQDIIVFPDITTDAKLSTLPSGIWNSLAARMRAKGFNTGSINFSESFGEAITVLGQQLVADFVDDNVDVPDVP